MEKSKNLSPFQAIIAPLHGVFIQETQHWGCWLLIWASFDHAAHGIINMIIRCNFIFCNFCPQNSVDSPPWVATNLSMSKCRRGRNSETKRPIAKISPLFTLQLSILSTGACFKVILRKFKGTFETFSFYLWHPWRASLAGLAVPVGEGWRI